MPFSIDAFQLDDVFVNQVSTTDELYARADFYLVRTVFHQGDLWWRDMKRHTILNLTLNYSS